MQIKRLYIENYKWFKKFEVFFDHHISVFIWENGSWKSRILEFLAEVFVQTLSEKREEIKSKFEITFDDGTLINEWNYLEKWPFFDRVVAYYAGDNTRLHDLFDEINSKEASKTATGDILLNQRIFYLYKNYYNYILLAIFTEAATHSILANRVLWNIFIWWKRHYTFSKEEEANYWDLDHQNRITLKKFSFNFIYPKWWKKQTLWWAKWILGTILESFINNSEEYKNSLYALEKLDRRYELSSKEKAEVLDSTFNYQDKQITLNFNNTEFISSNPELYWNWFWILEALNLLHVNGILADISLEIEVDGKAINSNTLSEGERQKINIDWLHLYFWKKWNSLFLLDEPDSFLHPNWQMKLIPNILKNYTWDDSENTWDDDMIWMDNPPQMIISTHSPLTVWSGKDYDIVWLRIDETMNTYIHCHTKPVLFWDKSKDIIKPVDVYGNRAEFIYEEIFWLEDTRARAIYDQAKELHLLLLKPNLSDSEKEKIKHFKQELKERLGDDPKDAFLSYLDTEDILEIFKTSYEKNKQKSSWS